MTWEDDHNRRVRAMPLAVRDAHGHSSGHRQEVLASTLCGCFHCLAILAPAAIREWVDEDDTGVGQTALCPRCGVDSVIGDSSGVAISRQFLEAMKAHWF